MCSIHYIIFAPEMGYFDQEEVEYKGLLCNSYVSNVVCPISLELSVYY